MTEQQTVEAEAGSLGREPKVIKRYANRKLYDTVESRYVTLEEIAEMVKAGTEVRILDNRTKEDLTSVTLAQIIFEEEKKTSKMSLRTLKDLIRHGSERAQQLVEEAQADIREKVQTFVPRVQATGDRAKDLVAASQEAVSQFQRRIDERVRATVDGMANIPELRRDLQQLNARLEDLERRLADLDR
ncbi:MAG TPA: polyhydroxyalkanoate synthesis regulator DNA-binding domain-containing protein [Anaeromyxobacteraceae bacterium]|nr:polyhydroxyalkanoate synthesis regulator DNA-binding domain-containing protein [Anaeromyxobacteraceae bacterium]